jgi:hypothetical protein
LQLPFEHADLLTHITDFLLQRLRLQPILVELSGGLGARDVEFLLCSGGGTALAVISRRARFSAAR